MKMKPKKGASSGAKRCIDVKGKWKTVEVDPSVFAEEGLEGLVCFEELRNYRLVDPRKVTIKAEKELNREKKKAKKRKASEEEEGEEWGDVETKEEARSTEPAKKKAKKKNKKVTSKESESIPTEVEDTEKASSGISARAQSKNAKSKKKKKSKQQTEKHSVTPKSTSGFQPLKNEKPSQGKVTAPPQKQAKNWTSAALLSSDGKTADVSAWKDLFVPPPVLKALSSLGFSAPTPIQALALPPAIRDRMNILGAAETGSGKTLAFGIPMIHTILKWKNGSETSAEDNGQAATVVESLYLPSVDESTTVEDKEEEEEGAEDSDDDVEEDEENHLGCVRVIENAEFDLDHKSAAVNRPLLGLVLTPTRELAVQVKLHIDAVAKFTDIKTALVVGGMAQHKQRRVLNHRPEIIIATPGRLWDLIKERHPHLLNLKQLKCLVIDEADRMVERGHFAELESLLEMLSTTHFNPVRQTFVFSATLTMVHSLPLRVLQKKKKNLEQRNKLEILMEKVGIKSKPKVIDLTRKEATVETLIETQIQCPKDDKDMYLYYFLLQYPGRTMVFANSIDCIKRLNSLLVILDCNPLPLHANMHQKQRLKNLERFAERESCVLLTTDVAARGLDIPNVQHVIHYQVPRTSETYVHRSGRTARATKEGLCLLLISPDDMMNFKKIFKTLGKEEDLPMFPIESKCFGAIKERVDLARSIEKIEFYNSREKQHNSWLKQAADALELDLDDDLLIGKIKISMLLVSNKCVF
ncbi:ATP-dependent RNA helicase DDX24 [Pholidichthys leucotaenia]